MATTGLSAVQQFVRECLTKLYPDTDVSPGSEADQKLIQPLLQRLGTDPLNMDVVSYCEARLREEQPDAYQSGDALDDLMVQPLGFLLEPVLRGIEDLRRSRSFRDGASLTLEEVDSLASHFFKPRALGVRATATLRVYYAKPTQVDVTPSNYARSRQGLRFYPRTSLSIRSDEMAQNVSGDLYYLDIPLEAEAPGDEYNVEANEITYIALPGNYTKATNLTRAIKGLPEEDAQAYLDRLERSLGEESLVTERGLFAQVPTVFPETTRMATVGMGDPEMRRDVLEGGALGPIRAYGVTGQTLADGEGKPTTRRFYVDPAEGVDFTLLIGPALGVTDRRADASTQGLAPPGVMSTVDAEDLLVGDADLAQRMETEMEQQQSETRSFVLTVFRAYGADAVEDVRDLRVDRVISPTTIEVVDQVFEPNLTNLFWTLRKRELLLHKVPGGILVPQGPNGEVSVSPEQVHVGGAFDTYVHAGGAETQALVLDRVVDETPVLAGTRLRSSGGGLVVLEDLTLSTDYLEQDNTYRTLSQAQQRQYTLQILSGPAGLQGSYRVVEVSQVNGANPVMAVLPAPMAVEGTFRWRLLDDIDVNLVAPREAKLEGTDLLTTQNTDLVFSGADLNFEELGIGVGDTIELINGFDRGEYTIKDVPAPDFTALRLDRKLRYTAGNVQYKIYRKNLGGGLLLPLLRITKVALLDSTGQPTGTEIPYAHPVSIVSRGFSNVAHGVQWDVEDGMLGLVSEIVSDGGLDNTLLDNETLQFLVYEQDGTETAVSVQFSFPVAGFISFARIVEQVNQAFGYVAATEVSQSPSLPAVAFGLYPGPNQEKIALIGGSPTILSALFQGNALLGISTHSVRSAEVTSQDGWGAASGGVDTRLGVLQVRTGYQQGVYDGLSVTGDGAYLQLGQPLQPEVRRHLQMGTRSLGSARLFFLNPTSITVDHHTRFFVEHATGPFAGQRVAYRPDPTLLYQMIPPSGGQALEAQDPAQVPKDGYIDQDTDVFLSTGTDFLSYGLRARDVAAIPPQHGDMLEITYQPIRGTVALADPVLNLALTRITLRVGSGRDREVIFLRDSTTIPAGAVTRAGVAQQINQAFGMELCAIVQDGTDYYLEFNPTIALTIRAGTGLSTSANTLLGIATGPVDVTNDSPYQGMYEILALSANSVQVYIPGGNGLFSSHAGTLTRQQFRVHRQDMQRIIATHMATQLSSTDEGLYYFDVELVSEGTGDIYNIPENLSMTMRGHQSDGYWLSNEEPALAYSPQEVIHMHLSRSILEVGADDDPDQRVLLADQSLQIEYETSQTISQLDSYLRADSQRAINANPLAKQLPPHYIRLAIRYQGNPSPAALQRATEAYIAKLETFDRLEASDIIALLSRKGVTSVTTPFTLIALTMDDRRQWRLQRSEDGINLGRLAAFVPDDGKISFTRG